MEYIYLLLACIFFSLQFIFQKHFEKRTTGGLSVCLWNLLISSAVMAVFLMIKSGLPTKINVPAFFYGLLYSVRGIICSVATLTAMSYGKVSAVSTYCLLGGIVIPFFYGIFSLGETAGAAKWLGIVILCLSLLPSFLKKDTEEAQNKDNVKFVFYCALVFLTNGLISIFSKMHQISAYAVDENSFVLVTAFIRCIAAFLIIFILAAMQKKKGEKSVFKSAFWEIGCDKMTGKLFLMLIVFAGSYAICNAVGNLFSLRCMVTMDASFQFPILSAVVIILSAIFGRIFFKEKITKDVAVSLLLSVVGIGLFMVK